MRFVHTADTHLGFEVSKVAHPDPAGRKRRAGRIVSNFLAVVDHAAAIEADFFIHGGDLFNKYYLPPELLHDLAAPLFGLARSGTRVLLIPGNHERSAFPFDLFQGSEAITVFDRPRSLCFGVNGYSIAFAGFPFIREDSRRLFAGALAETEYSSMRRDVAVLLAHQSFDGAVVGPAEYTFRTGRPDTVSRAAVPTDLDYIAAGHIHRHQILTHPLKPELVFAYPGSTQRMSFAEMEERKGFLEGELLADRIETRFVELPAYGMEIVEIEAAGMSSAECRRAIEGQSWRFREDLVIRFSLTGGRRKSDYPDVDFRELRRRLPPALECQFAIRTARQRILC